MPSKLEQMQQQFRRQLLQEKEERMIKIHTESQQKALSKVSRYNGFSSVPTVNPQPQVPAPHHSPVKKGSPGVDRSRPLPPISNARSYTSTRTSPVSAPTDNTTTSKVADVSSRSKSVDLVDSRSSPPVRGQQQNDGGDARNASPPVGGQQNENGNWRNGYGRLSETKSRPGQNSDYEKRPDPETVAKLKQAELQRLRAKQVRDETPPRTNGFSSDTMSKSSTTTTTPQRKTPATTKPTTTTTAAPNRARLSFQGAPTASIRKTAAPPSKPARGGGRAPPPTGSHKSPGPGQEQCRVCGRNFNSDRIEKHVSICSKASQKKLKVFDATKMRVKGTEAEQFVRKGLPKNEQLKPKQSDWRKKRNEFIEAIRQAKLVQQHLAKGGKVSDLPPPKPSDNSDYVPCPHCGRKFSEGVAERHIPKCKNIMCNKKNPAPRRK